MITREEYAEIIKNPTYYSAKYCSSLEGVC